MEKAISVEATSEASSLSPFLDEILARLKQIYPEKIILFGSQATDRANAESDLDLIVVTSDEVMPSTYHEKEEIYLRVARLIRDIRQETPVDLIVHTRPMHERFLTLNSLFAQEVQEKGVVLYEKDH